MGPVGPCWVPEIVTFKALMKALPTCRVGPGPKINGLTGVTILLIGGYNNPLVYLVGANCV